MSEKRRFGDRKDGKLIRDIDAIHVAMSHLYDNRTSNEAFISETINLEPIKAWLAVHGEDAELRYSFFHVIVAAIAKILVARPKMNRFISDKKYYQRNENVISFIVKRQFTEEAKEGQAVVRATADDTVFTIHEKLKEQIIPCKKGENSATEDGMDILMKMPEWMRKIVFGVILWVSKKGWLPASWIEGDSNHSSVFVTNLGSIGLKCGYHHLSNYGTCSVFIIIGEKKTVREL